MSRLGWQHLWALCATAWHDSREDRLSQSSANLPTAVHPFYSSIGGKGYEECECGQSKQSLSLQLAGALDHVQLATIARFYIEGLLLLIINGFANDSLPSIALSVPRAREDISAFLCAYWISLRTVIGKSPRQLVAESRPLASRPTTTGRHRQVFSRWFGAVPALLQLSFCRLRGVLAAAAARDSGVTERSGSEPTTTPSAGSNPGRINKNNPNKRKRKRSPKEPGGPRPRKTPSGSGSGNESDSSSEREPPPPGPKGKTRKAKAKGPRYACPFAKRHPFHYAKCLGQPQEGWRRVKQHLTRSHVQPIYCPTCFREFEEQQDCNKHIVARVCEESHAGTPPAGMTPDQQKKLDNITGAGEDGKWFAMWAVLFPDADRPSSPYADDLAGFMAGEVHRWCKPLYEALLRHMINDDQFERFYGRLMRSSSAFLSTFSGPSADGQPSSLDAFLEDWFGNNPEEPPDDAARAFSPVPQTGPLTLPGDGSGLDASTFQPIDSTRNISIPQQTANHPEITMDGPMRPEDEPDFTLAWAAIQFPTSDGNQFADTFPSAGQYQDAGDPQPSTSSFDGFGFGQTNPHLDAGYPLAPRVYRGPELFQHGSSLSGWYGPRTPQQSPTAALSGGLMNDYGNDNFTPHMAHHSPGATSFIQAAAGRHSGGGGHAQGAVGGRVSALQPRQQQQHNQYERTGPRHF